jgi:hypothetical protein
MTKYHPTRLKAVIMSSTTPSAKYSCSGSPLMFVKGRTAMEGLSGYQWRSGRKVPSGARIAEIARALDVAPEALLEPNPDTLELDQFSGELLSGEKDGWVHLRDAYFESETRIEEVNVIGRILSKLLQSK